MEPKNLIVQLFVPTDDKRGRIGSAYPVAKNVLLTAAHVVGDANGDEIEARWWHQPESHRQWKHCTDILWDGRDQSPKTDVVLLRCEFPVSVQTQWGHLAAIRPRDHTEWASEGFPFVGEKNSKPVPLQGKTHSMGDRSEHFHLQVLASADTEEGWQGASGSPVFVKESIIGVIVNSPRNFNAERFEAVPLFRLLENDEFRAHVDYSEAEDQRKQLADAAVHELAQSEEAMSELSKLLKLAQRKNREQWAQSNVEALLDESNPTKVATRIVKAQTQFGDPDDAHQRAVKCLDTVAMYLIPASLATQHVQQIRVIADTGQRRYGFHARTKTFIEMAMARLHGRPARYRLPKSQRDEPPGVLSLENPVEAEIDKQGEQFKQDFVYGLCDAMALPNLSDRGFEESVEAVNDELELRDELGEGLHYYVFQIPETEDEKRRRLSIIEKLDELFPRITFIGLEPGKGTSDERKSVRSLMRILCRAAGIRWEIDVQAETSERSGQAD